MWCECVCIHTGAICMQVCLSVTNDKKQLQFVNDSVCRRFYNSWLKTTCEGWRCRWQPVSKKASTKHLMISDFRCWTYSSEFPQYENSIIRLIKSQGFQNKSVLALTDGEPMLRTGTILNISVSWVQLIVHAQLYSVWSK